jgi:hypothetical protein
MTYAESFARRWIAFGLDFVASCIPSLKLFIVDHHFLAYLFVNVLNDILEVQFRGRLHDF